MSAGLLTLAMLFLGLSTLVYPPTISDQAEARIRTRILCTEWVSRTAWQGRDDASDQPTVLGPQDHATLDELNGLIERLPLKSKERHWAIVLSSIRPEQRSKAEQTQSHKSPRWLSLLVQAHTKTTPSQTRKEARAELWQDLSPWYFLGNALVFLAIIGVLLWLLRRKIWPSSRFRADHFATIVPMDVLGMLGAWILFRVVWSVFVPVFSKKHPTATVIVEYLPQVLVGMACISYILMRSMTPWSALGVRKATTKRVIRNWIPWGLCGIAMALPIVFSVQWLNQFLVHITDPVFPIVLDAMEQGHLIWLIVITVIIAPVFEELLFRGLVYGSMRRIYGARTSNIIQAFFFSLLHFSPTTFLPLFVLGLILGVLREQFDDIAPAVITHALWNGMVLTVFQYFLRI